MSKLVELLSGALNKKQHGHPFSWGGLFRAFLCLDLAGRAPRGGGDLPPPAAGVGLRGRLGAPKLLQPSGVLAVPSRTFFLLEKANVMRWDRTPEARKASLVVTSFQHSRGSLARTLCFTERSRMCRLMAARCRRLVLNSFRTLPPLSLL